MLVKLGRTVLMVILTFVTMIESVGWAATIADHSGQGDRSVLVVVGSTLAFLAGSSLHLVVHELGHLAAASTLRLPVKGVRILNMQFGAPGARRDGAGGHVLVDLRLPQRALPPRMVGFAAGGPLANVAFAAITALIASTQSVPLEARVVAVGLTTAGFLAAFVNLLPLRQSSAQASDGLALLRWTFLPGKELARIRRRRDLSDLRSTPPSKLIRR